ncbi:MAG: hypothetical protein JNL35_14525 [Sphingopyxis sp.]|nr:hypothetical protein [Sphingopyxis sp.]
MKPLAGAARAAVFFLALALSSASPAAAAGKNRPYLVMTTGMVILPPVDPVKVGSERTVKEGDTIFRAPLGWFEYAVADSDVSVKIAELDWKIAANAKLNLVAGKGGGDLALLPATADIYCDEPKNDVAKDLLNGLTLGLSQLGARFAKSTRLCLVDTDSNGDFDKAFLVGLKKAEDRFLVPITPIAFKRFTNQPIDDKSFVEVVFYDGGMLNGPNFKVQPTVSGTPMGIAAINVMATMSPGARLIRIPMQQDIKRKKLPNRIIFGTARIEVKSVDAATKTATFRYTGDWIWSPFIPTYPTQIIYVYY